MLIGLEINYYQSQKNVSGSCRMTQTFNFLACGKFKTVLIIQFDMVQIILRSENKETWAFINAFVLQGH